MTGTQAKRDIKVRVLEPQPWTYSFADWANALTFAQDQEGLVQIEQPSERRYVTIQGGQITMAKGDVAIDGAQVVKARRKLGKPAVVESELRPAAGQVWIVKDGRTPVGMFLLKCCAETQADKCHSRAIITVADLPDVAQELRMAAATGPTCICRSVLGDIQINEKASA